MDVTTTQLGQLLEFLDGKSISESTARAAMRQIPGVDKKKGKGGLQYYVVPEEEAWKFIIAHLKFGPMVERKGITSMQELRERTAQYLGEKDAANRMRYGQGHNPKSFWDE